MNPPQHPISNEIVVNDARFLVARNSLAVRDIMAIAVYDHEQSLPDGKGPVMNPADHDVHGLSSDPLAASAGPVGGEWHVLSMMDLVSFSRYSTFRTAPIVKRI